VGVRTLIVPPPLPPPPPPPSVLARGASQPRILHYPYTDHAATAAGAVAAAAIDRCDFCARPSFALIGFSFPRDAP